MGEQEGGENRRRKRNINPTKEKPIRKGMRCACGDIQKGVREGSERKRGNRKCSAIKNRCRIAKGLSERE